MRAVSSPTGHAVQMKFETPRSKNASANDGAKSSDRRSGRFGVMPDWHAFENTNGGRRSIRRSSREESTSVFSFPSPNRKIQPDAGGLAASKKAWPA